MRRFKDCFQCAAAVCIIFALSNACSRHTANDLSVYGQGWSAVHADGSNSDYSPVPGARDLELAWSREFAGGAIYLGATSDDAGRVFVTTTAPGCHFYALRQATGETLWCSDQVNRSAVASAALLDRNSHVFLADNKAMRAFDIHGNVLWETSIAGFTLSAQFTPSGHVIFITHIGRIYVLRRDTGEHVLPPIELIPGATYDPDSADQPVLDCMRGTANCPSANTIAVDPRTGRFFFTFFAPGAPQAGIRAMQYREYPTPSITSIWTNDSLPGGSGSSPDISADGARLYVNDNVDSIHAIDTATGKTLWRYPIGWASGGSPSTSPEGIIMPTGGGPLMAIIDKGDHAELLWRKDEIRNRSIPTQAAGGVAYAAVSRGGAGNDLIVVDTLNGEVLDRVPLPGDTLFTVGTTVGLDGVVYVATIRGQLFALRPAGKGF
ncbi:MAG: PQQ-binding-like beta-propeller repeat protein [Deltaproteobacteria bacterium]|nr:PQQ-binding-like beta-propeller repeat protein [Deltaproteobacteria bacterium]